MDGPFSSFHTYIFLNIRYSDEYRILRKSTRGLDDLGFSSSSKYLPTCHEVDGRILSPRRCQPAGSRSQKSVYMQIGRLRDPDIFV